MKREWETTDLKTDKNLSNKKPCSSKARRRTSIPPEYYSLIMLEKQQSKNKKSLCEAKLIPVHIHAANKNNIKMIGTIILWFYDSSKCRQNLKWIVYVMGDADKLSLSQESCTALGRFSLHFLTMDEALYLTPATKPDKVSEATGKLTHALYHIHLRVHWACLVTLHITSSHCLDQLVYHSQQ